MDGSVTACRASVSAIAGNAITVTVVGHRQTITPAPYCSGASDSDQASCEADDGTWVVPDSYYAFTSGDPLVVGNSAINTHVLMLTGTSRGNYYRISVHNGTSDSLTLDMSQFPTSSIQVGDILTISASFVGNDISYNTMYVDNPISGLQLYTACYGNTINGNTLIKNGVRGGIGLMDLGYAWRDDGSNNSTPAAQIMWWLNSANSYSGNTVRNFGTSFQSATYGTYGRTGPYWNIRTGTTDQFRSTGISATNNNFEVGIPVLVLSESGMTWANNMVTPSVTDTWLGTGLTDTTWLGASPFATKIPLTHGGKSLQHGGVRLRE